RGGGQDDWHAVVDRLHQFVGARGQVCATLDFFTAFVIRPHFPQTSERERLSSPQADGERLLCPVLLLLPFVEGVRWNQAAALLERGTKCRFLGGGFRAGVNKALAVPRPRGDQAPLESDQFPASIPAFTDGGDRRRRRRVEARTVEERTGGKVHPLG